MIHRHPRPIRPLGRFPLPCRVEPSRLEVPQPSVVADALVVRLDAIGIEQLVLVTLAIARLGIRPLTVGLVVASIAINAWGVYWGVTLGW